MKWLMIIAAVFCIAGTAHGGECRWAMFGHVRDWPRCVQGGCCDDYCPKPPPCVGTKIRFQCFDYCQKCPPCVSKTGPFTCDDYCRKPYPRLLCAPVARTVPADCACDCCPRDACEWRPNHDR